MEGYGWAPPGSQGSHYWVPQCGGSVPPGAVQAGYDLDGGPIYVGRATHCGDLLPAKACPSHGCAFVSYGGEEISVSTYEVTDAEENYWPIENSRRAVCTLQPGLANVHEMDFYTRHVKGLVMILVASNVAWRSASGGEVPPQSIRVGQTASGEPLYVGRTMHQGTFTPGKVHPSHGCLYIPYGGEELQFTDYEILVSV